MPANAIILDANLLVLLVVGLTSRSYIVRHKRLAAYSANDFDLLVKLIGSPSRIVVTPNTVTETSNLTAQITEPARTQIMAVMGRLLQKTEEVYIESRIAATHKSFSRLGVTDSVLLNVMAEDRTLLTVDLDLYIAATRRGLKAVNFNHHI